ncbi:pro-neuregulin-2, membrane-bound isoform-like isoform X2 [Megalops cyprinoides]|uniref:pro-neuregulin-2, membrane-bound isoform-like isoform X2 n=1 Tax=Megalops cyprinoides TaxID=118141 RepID=UPI0018643159|nr:pro-neuregulin-2, membrane-bound isoform-like isoform X2 [Megalops cyprinoides]
MRLDSVHFSMLVIGVSFACYSPSLNSLQDQAYKSTVVIEGKVHSVPANVSTEPYSVNVKVLDVWPLNSGGLEREQLVTVGEFGSEAPCTKVIKNHRYIFFMDPTDEPLVFKASFAPLDTSGNNLKKDVGRILCEDCATAPKLKRLKNQSVTEGTKLTLRCEATGNPSPTYRWFKDGSELKKNKEIKIKSSKKNSRVQINRAKLEDSGNYTCVAENMLGKENATSTVSVQSITTTLSPGSGHARRCNETEKAYCVNGGDCYFIHGINQLSCKCPAEFFGPRCLQTEPLRLYMPKPHKKAEELYKKRVLTITGICVALLVVGIVCVVAYCKTKKQRKKMHNHLRQNMCADNPNRNLANGPNHPGPGPEEIPMVDYISKNVPATERVIRHGAETSFTGSRASSRSHHSSTATHSSSHRHEDRTWSLDRTESVISDSHSGMMSSSVGTSKCNSPACMEARARRAAHCGITEPHHPTMQYRDSFDSLGDSPHSDRYVSALTTPARLSPVDFHYSLPPQVPTFQITSPNASHAMSLPPAAHMPFYLEDDQPLLRRYQVPLQDIQRQEPYRQQQPLQHRTYLNDSTGSLPSSPYRLADDEEYETTQEYLSSLEQPKRSASGGGRRWRRSRLNGHVSPRGQAARDYSSQSCLSDSDSEGEEHGESTPFLSMQNMNAEPATIYRPVDSRTYQPSSGRHGARGNTQTRLAHSRSKPDNAPL